MSTERPGRTGDLSRNAAHGIVFPYASSKKLRGFDQQPRIFRKSQHRFRSDAL